MTSWAGIAAEHEPSQEARRAPRLTRRLELVAVEPKAYRELHGIHQDPATMRFIGFGHPHTMLDCEREAASLAAHWDAHGFGMWVARERASGEVVGHGGLKVPHLHPNLRSSVDFGCLIGRMWWGLGYGAEIGQASLQFGFEVLARSEVLGLSPIDHAPSRSMMLGLGMSLASELDHPTYGTRQVVYRITRSEWCSRCPLSTEA